MTASDSTDQRLTCAGCGEGFVFTAGEQELYRLRGVTHEPNRCPPCARGRFRGPGSR